MIGIPYIVEPPDILDVEVLEALPGRPITGERLVRSDGTINLGFYGDLQAAGLTTTQIKEKIIYRLRKFLPDAQLGLVERENNGSITKVAPADSDRVFVDVTAYNSKVYYVQGDVAAPGRIPVTGKETVLDALNYAGHLTTTADEKNIRLIRPARGGKPAKVYPIDLAAIVERGDDTTNLQLFPGDRVFVGRHPVEKASASLRRLSEPFALALQQMQNYSNMIHSLELSAKDPALTPTQREAIVKGWIDFIWSSALRPEGPALDEKTFREGLMRQFIPITPPPDATKSERMTETPK